MAYAILYTAQFKDRLLASTFKVDILQDGYGGGSTTITYMGVDPVSLKYKSDKGKDQHIIGSSLTFSFMSLPADNDKYDALFVGAEKEFKVNYYKDSVLIWTGYLQPDNLSRSYFNKLYQITLNASDWLANLKEVEFRNGSSNYTDELSVLATIKTCLEFTGIALDFYTQINTWETTYMTSTTDVLNNLYVHLGRFTKVENGKTKYTSVYDVIKEVLKPHNISLKQVGGRYHLINIYEVNSFYRIHTWSTLAAGARTATDHIVNIDSFNFSRDSSVTKLKPQLRLDIERFADDQGGELIADTDDFTGGGPWTITAPDGYTETTDQIIITTNDGGATEHKISISTSSQTGIAGRYIDLQFDTFFEIYEPFVSIVLKVTKPISGLQNYTIKRVGDNLQHIQSPTIDKFEMDEDGVYLIEIYFDEDLETVDPVDWTIQNVRINSKNIDETEFDRNYIGYIDQDAQVKDLELFFADGDTDTDRGAFKAFSSGYVKTVAWNRYNETDGLTIQEIYLLNLLKNRQAYKDSISILALDDSFEIDASTIIQIDTKNHKIIELEAVDNKNTKKLLLEELLTSDPTYTFTTSTLSSVGGVSTGSNDPTGEAQAHGDLSGLANDDHPQYALLAAAFNQFTGRMGIGKSPVSKLDIYQNDSATGTNAGATIEQDGTGDAILQFLLTASQRWVIGVDNSDSNKFKISPNSDVGTDGFFSMDVSGNLEMEGEITAYGTSDKELKKKVEPFCAKGIIKKLNPKTFKWNQEAKKLNQSKNDRNNFGLIAQDTEKVLPELIRPIYGKYKSIDYQQIISINVQALKELIEITEYQSKEIEKLKLYNLNQWKK